MRTPIFNIAPGKTINYHGHPCLVLEQYSTRELTEELFRRFQKEEEAK